jgi:hypothetical protein
MTLKELEGVPTVVRKRAFPMRSWGSSFVSCVGTACQYSSNTMNRLKFTWAVVEGESGTPNVNKQWNNGQGG